ncbi:hypothetical protein HZA55_07460 [Candidatus Poribacteria bacterium]|nr:hypothetical protein [Candidatus Poribacteria bacterium]
MNISGKVHDDLILLRGVFFVSYPDKFRLEIKSAMGNIEKILIINSNEIKFKDLAIREEKILACSRKNFFNLTGIDYDPHKLFLFLSGTLELSPEEKYSANLYDKKYIVLKSSLGEDKIREIWWDEKEQVINKVIVLKDANILDEIEFMNFDLNLLPGKIIIRNEDKVKLKIILSDISMNVSQDKEIFDK